MSLFEIDCSDIAGIIEDCLKVDNSLKTIHSIFKNERYLERVNYSPYFQRNYVWDKSKASYFVESILLGTEIPPIVLFADGRSLEVIDGRQRFETILRFIRDDFALKEEGLKRLTGLSGMRYSVLPDDMRAKFDDAKLRILQFSVVNEPSMNEVQKDKIKKEIFNRYNSGIIPLKSFEIERAEYDRDDLTSQFISLFTKDEDLFRRAELLFTAPRSRKGERRDRVYKLLSHVRTLLTLPYVPIRSYAYGSNKPSIVRTFFEAKYANADAEAVIERFVSNMELVEGLVAALRGLGSEFADNLMLHQVFFWGFYVLSLKGFDLRPFDAGAIAEAIVLVDDADYPWEGVADDYRTLEKALSQTGSHYDKAIIGRYTLCANLLARSLDVDFGANLKNPGLFEKVMESCNPCRQFEDYRISKADPHTETIYDIMRSISAKRFEIRPSYQRSETTDSKKASYLIESIMLDIRIPPIFVCKRDDGVSEVIDGQQRLLSIMGFLGDSYYDENCEVRYSLKNRFKLKGLRVLKAYNGMGRDDLEAKDPVVIDRLLDFGIEVIEVDMARNPNFSPIDLFLRLNQKPFPIKPNSFELWNSYLNRVVIDKAREIVKDHPGSFFKAEDPRMLNEELVMVLGYVAYQTETGDKSGTDVFDVFVRNDKISARVRDKNNVTSVLDKAAREDADEFLHSLGCVDEYLVKLEVLTGEEFRNLKPLFSNSKGQIRVTNKNAYLLWILLAPLDVALLRQHRDIYMHVLKEFFEAVQHLSQDTDVKTLLDEWENRLLCVPYGGEEIISAN